MHKDETAVWRHEIQHGPEGEANYAWLYRGNEMIATMKTHHAATISAALSALVEEKLGVKKLGWITCGPVAYAITPFGSYEVRPNTGNTNERLEVDAPMRGNSTIAVGSDEAAMRAFAQSDYESRIRNALVDVPAVESEPLGYISAYGLEKLQTRNHYCVSVSHQSEKEFVIPIYGIASPVRSALAPAPAGEDVALQQNLRDTFEALCAMRDSINEHIPMPSLESDLLRGPETTVFCSVVAEAVISAIQDCSTLSRKPSDAQTVGDGSTSDASGGDHG